jgi:RNA polymerase sigma-70 factor (ECF subfamily)
LGEAEVQGGTQDRRRSPESGLDFAGLFREHYPRIYNYFRYRVNALEDAEDLTGVTFERAYAHRGRFDETKGTFSAWLFRIAHNVLANHYRTRQRRSAYEAESDLPADLATPAPSPEAQVIQGETIARLLRGLRGLSQRDQEVIALKFAGSLSNREIGQIMGLKEKTVSVVLWRAMGRLERQVKGDMP